MQGQCHESFDLMVFRGIMSSLSLIIGFQSLELLITATPTVKIFNVPLEHFTRKIFKKTKRVSICPNSIYPKKCLALSQIHIILFPPEAEPEKIQLSGTEETNSL